MTNPFKEFSKYLTKSVRRAPLLWQIRNLVSWVPLHDPEDGYTIVIAAMHELWPVAAANLRLIARCDQTELQEVIVVIDHSEEHIPGGLRNAIDEIASQGLRIRVIGYTPDQLRVARRIHWGWVYSWLSWSIGISESQTKWVLLHDLDAMPIDAGIFRRLFSKARDTASQFQGIRYYSGNGVNPEMRLVTTFEMTLDAQWLRDTAKPIDCFNQIRLVDSKYIDFDTLLNVQRQASNRSVEPIPETSLVHPSQLICQYTDLVAGRKNRILAGNRLPVLYYFMHLGNPDFDLSALGSELAHLSQSTVRIFGHSVDISQITPSSWAWMEKQIRRLEQTLYSSTRDHINDYLRGIITRAGDSRTVGRESMEADSVADR